MAIRPTRFRRILAVMLAATLAACAPLESIGIETAAVKGTPPLADGPIPDDYRRFVESLWPAAQSAGVSRRTFDAAFAGVGPDQDVLDKAARQAEFVKPIWEYLDGAASETRIRTGREMLTVHADLLTRLENTYGVQRQIILAVWGMESSFGAVLDNPKVVKNVVRALSTLAWKGGRRAKFGRTQLIAVLRILEQKDIDPRHMTGSWAGAMGHTQFIPTTYQAYAVDFDGDGRRNIWTSIPDALASTANYLRKAGWRPGETWGYEVALPAGLDVRSGQSRSIADWAALGVRRASGDPFPRPGDKATLFMPAGRDAPVFLTLHNFRVIKRYNNADAYALGVGHLSDRIIGGGAFAARWPRDYEPLTEAERFELQERRQARGCDVGGVDGKIGPSTLDAIRAFQAAAGVPVKGNPSPDVLDLLRAGG